LLPKVIKGVYGSLEWGLDSKTLYWSILDEIHRPYKVFKQSIEQEDDNSELIFEEPDQKFELSIYQSNSGKFLLLQAESFLSREVWTLDLADPKAAPKIIQKREKGILYSVEHHEQNFFIRTDKDNSDNFFLLKAPQEAPSKENWKEILPYDPEVFNESMILFKNFLVIFQRSNGRQRLRCFPVSKNSEIDPKNFTDISFNEPVYNLSVDDHQDYDHNILRFSYSSFITPEEVVDYNLETGQREVKSRKNVKGFDPSQYVCERIYATSHDGTQVPVSIVYKKGIEKNGDNPLHLYGYGSYCISIDPYFDNQKVSLYDRGIIHAIAHIRGGGENGRLWYKNGKFLKKKNTFLDFIASAEALIKEGYTNSSKLAIQGASAGGLLIGAVLHLKPELFKVAFASVPFVDVVNTMMDATIPLTVNEYEEWGNPNEIEYFNKMLEYSPYNNIRKGLRLPHLYVKAGLNDSRVQYWEPAKFVAKIREVCGEENQDRLIVLKTEMGAGHFGQTGRYDYLKEIAAQYAFIIHFLTIEKLE